MTKKLIPFDELPAEDQTIIQDILHLWFGLGNESDTPSAERLALWFEYQPEIVPILQSHFQEHIIAAGKGTYDHWLQCIQGQLAMIILLSQFTKLIYKLQPEAYQYDAKALLIALEGAQIELEHDLSLIERAFYYFPFLQSEDPYMLANGLSAYQILEEYALPETKTIYQKFLDKAVSRAKILQAYGRYPWRNAILGRKSTDDELLYMQAFAEDNIL